MPCPPKRNPLDSGTASAIRPSKGAAFLEPIPSEKPLKAGEFVLGYRDEMGGMPRYLSPRFWAGTAPTSSSANCINGWLRSAGI